MQWNKQQTEALDRVGKWLTQRDEQVFHLFGYAGTGKTTLAKYLAKDAGHVLFGAYTGKAASVMRDSGCSGATTIHSLIYLVGEKSKGKLLRMQAVLTDLLSRELPAKLDNPRVMKLKRLIYEERQRIKQPAFTLNIDSEVRDASLVIIDECSMVNERIGQDLLSFGVPVLVLGDPAQLPPVKGGGFFTDHKPEVMLTEIHRQAWGNPIIDMATRVRMGEVLHSGKYGDSEVLIGKPPEELVLGVDQVLVGKNATRRSINAKMRRLLGKGENDCPVVGDKLVCLRNDHEVGLLNGTIWRVDHVDESVFDEDRVNLTISNGTVTGLEVEAHMHYFQGKGDDLGYWEIRDAQCFDYGYALTCHKAQGSQWDSVLVFDESHVFRQNACRWLYTAITRAAKRVTICR